MAWTEILNQNGDPEVFLGASSNSDGTVFIVDGLVGGSNAAVNNGNDTLTDPALADYDVFYGGRGSDILTGGSANEVFIGGAGNDRLIGGDGIDSAAFGGTRASYMLVKLGPDWQVTNIGGGEGQDTLRGIERLTFDDRLLALDLAGNAGLVVKTLGAVFGPASAHFATYVGIGLKLVDGGMSYTDLMQLALEVQLGTGASNAAVVTLLYTNLAGVPPGAGDLAAFTALLDNQTYSQPGLGVFAGDHALNLANIDLVGLTQTGLDFE